MLKVMRVSKTFNPGGANEVRALQRVSLQIEPGSFVVVLGTNGSGKSTLLNAVAGSFEVDTGKIVLEGRDITTWPEHKRARHFGRVFQNPFSGTAPDMTIAENFAMASSRGRQRGLQWALRPSLLRDLRARVRTLKMGLEDRLGNNIGSLSGGQRQALTLLMATWNRPDLLLLDEHTAALDPKSADQCIRLTEEVIAKEKLTTLMVTHSMQQAVNLGDRIIMMHRGRVIHDFRGADKLRMRVDDLLARFEEVRRRDQLDEHAAQLLGVQYV
ncbi:MAG: ATP-binding cassette domain-containing protein [Verrucomicrobiota bacterium]